MRLKSCASLRKHLLGATVMCAAATVAQAAQAGDVIVNGGFETGDFTGWTADPNPGDGSCGTPWNVGADTDATGCNSVANPMGSYAAYQAFDGEGPLVRTLSQQIAVGGGGLIVADLAWLQSISVDLDGYGATEPRIFKVELFDDEDALIGVVSMDTFDPDTYTWTTSWETLSHDVLSLLADQAGKTVTLSFTSVVPESFTGPAGIGLDDVSLDLQYFCTVSAGDDVCAFASDSPSGLYINAGDGDDIFRLGGAAGFSFDATAIGTSIANFETIEKTGATTIAVTGAAGEADWTVAAGVLQLGADDVFADDAAVTVASGATLDLQDHDDTVGTATIAGTLDGTGVLTAGEYRLNGATINANLGDGVIIQTGTASTINGSVGSGATMIMGGMLTFNGTIGGDVEIGEDGMLAGSADIMGDLMNMGIVSAGNSPGVITVAGDYTGGGVLLVEVQFDNVGAPVNGVTHDFLSIAGDVTGVTLIDIVSVTPSGSPATTTGDGVELVRVEGDVSPTAFALSGPVVVSGVEYDLEYIEDYSGTTDGFFLQTYSSQELALHSAMLAAGRAASLSCGRDLAAYPGMGGKSQRIWADASDTAFDSGASNGLGFNSDFNCFAAGIEFARGEGFQFGVSGGHIMTEAQVLLPQGVAVLDGDTNMFEAYAAYLWSDFFAVATVGYQSTEWNMIKAGGGALDADVRGIAGSVRIGYHKDVMDNTKLTLSAVAAYDGTDCGNGCLVANAIEDEANWIVSAHARLEAAFEQGRLRPYLDLGVYKDVDGGNAVSVPGALSKVDAQSYILKAGAGLIYDLTSNVALFAQGGWMEGVDSDASGHHGRAGVKVAW